MSSNLNVPDNLDEQDIGLYCHSRGSSLTISDTDISSLMMSRPASQPQLDTLGQGLALHSTHGSLKSPSLSQVASVRQDRGLTAYEPVLRSRTVPHLPSTASERVHTDDGPQSFALPMEKVKRMQEWALAFVVVQFDLELGPSVRSLYPPMYLSPAERENIAFSSFPDSLQFEQGSEVHSFRIRVYPHSYEATVEDEQRPRALDGFMYGFSHFCQKRDPTSKRGYQQTSLVLLARHQYPALYTSMISRLGPLFHIHGDPMLETACHNIASWQSPSPGSTVELGFLGSVLHVELPLNPDSQQLSETNTFHEQFNPAVHVGFAIALLSSALDVSIVNVQLLASSSPLDPPPIRLFEASLTHLWSMWECVVLCNPILVFGPSPALTSQAVWWLRDLIRPIPLAVDIRPYFTIHDKDHTLLVNKAPPRAGLLIGVTNPFFEKSCAHWPHVLSTGRKLQARRGSKTVMAGPSPGWTTKTHRRHISKDRQLLKSLEKACAGDEREQLQASLDMRRHFCARTNAMLVPLNRYLNMLMPSPLERSSGKAQLKPFSPSDFLASLNKSPSALPFKSSSRQIEFYDKWLRSPAFGVWLARQEEVIGALLREKAGAHKG